jgi:hypothetical protein
MPGIPREVIEHRLGIDPCLSQSRKKKEDTLQRVVKPFNKKSIDYSKLGSIGP